MPSAHWSASTARELARTLSPAVLAMRPPLRDQAVRNLHQTEQAKRAGLVGFIRQV
jgi:hypothetical protein